MSFSSDRCEGPDGLTNGLKVTANEAFKVYTTVPVTEGFVYLSASVWVKSLETGASQGLPCSVFVRNPGGSPEEVEPFYEDPAGARFEQKWKRIVGLFEVPGETGSLEVGLRMTQNPNPPPVELSFWGFQITSEPVKGPYVPNHTAQLSEAGGSVLELDKEDFEGFVDRGFVSFRVKLEERVDLLEDGRKLVLLEASDSGEPILNRALLTLGMMDGKIERRIAMAWDLSRPVALTGRHLAMWADGKRVGTYPGRRPADPMDQKLKLDTVRLGCGMDPDPVEDPLPELGHQPHAVLRELELLTRHHPGLYTPTRLEMREQAGRQRLK